jgi:hypothetical protein
MQVSSAWRLGVLVAVLAANVVWAEPSVTTYRNVTPSRLTPPVPASSAHSLSV